MRRVAFAALTGAVVLLMATPAWAHVTVSPPSEPRGASDVEITFRVPNEEPPASTTKLLIALPSSPPILNVDAQSVPGWTDAVQTTHLTKPIQTDDGAVTDVVTQVTWTANSTADGIKPGEFGRFEILVGDLPDTGDQIVFKALQTYSNGDVVRWIDPVTPNGSAAEHPTPILQLTSPTTAPAASNSTSAASATTTGLAKKSQVDSARTVGAIGIIIGALGLLAALVALLTRRRANAT